MGQSIGMRLDGRLSLRKGEGESEGLAGADAGNRNLHLCPLPFSEGRGEKQTAVTSWSFEVIASVLN
jgi:hypothetical protein